MPATVHPSADVDDRAQLGDGTTVWHLAQIRERAELGKRCVVGRGAYVGPGVRIGDDVKIQNHALVYDPAVIEASAFIGPAAVLSNDRHPRAVRPDGSPKGADDWEPAGVVVREGASIGANATVVAGVTIGRWALVGAGAVVTSDVADHALVVGTPARFAGWVGRAAVRLEPDGPAAWRCPKTGETYEERDGRLTPL